MRFVSSSWIPCRSLAHQEAFRNGTNASRVSLLGAHQPNFLPWIPFFSKLTACQVFVLLDDVQYPSQQWVNRVQIDLGGGLQWMTIPVRHDFGCLIREVRLDYGRDWVRKLLTSLRQSYARHPFFEEIYPTLAENFEKRPNFLIDLNRPLLDWLRQLLDISTTFHLGSELSVEGSGSARLVALCQKLSASAYQAGPAAQAYEDVEAYQRAGLTYVRTSFPPPQYHSWDGKARRPGLSIVDALMNLGSSATRKLLGTA